MKATEEEDDAHARRVEGDFASGAIRAPITSHDRRPGKDKGWGLSIGTALLPPGETLPEGQRRKPGGVQPATLSCLWLMEGKGNGGCSASAMENWGEGCT